MIAKELSKTAWKRFANDAGDIIESVGGAVNLDCPEARAFCFQHDIEFSQPRGLRTAISAYLQGITFFISCDGRDNFHESLTTM